FAVQSVARRTPAVFVDQTLWITTESDVVAAQLLQLGDDRLHKCRQRYGVIDARLRIANPKLNGVEKRMQPNVPPNLLCVIDAVRGDEQVQKILIFAEAFKRVGNACARKALKDHVAIRF